MIVAVYKNLSRQCWSVRHRGKVVAHVREIALADVEFHVCEAARERVVRNRRREVHAWAKGAVIATVPAGHRCAITYNPYGSKNFTLRASGTAIHVAPFVAFTAEHGAFAICQVHPRLKPWVSSRFL